MKDQQFWRARVQEGAVLNPVDRISEVLFGLIMVLTFTGAISVASDGREDIRELLWAALGCNVAWGLVDAVMYWMNVLLERGHAVTVIRKIVESDNTSQSRELLRNEIQPVVAALMKDEEVDQLVDRIQKLPEPTKHTLFTWRDLLSGVQIFLLVFLCTLPVALPFAFLDDVSVGMRASNGIAILQLFIGGFILAGYAGFRRFTTAMVYVVIGVLLVTLTMALGG
ncbi:MAG: VIT1/CCC1 transporter family protein [Flammeovirgaceae bacterium]|nr:VIT1/CCC1 transporter family protein [Flammeovirgaceae bacterium]